MQQTISRMIHTLLLTALLVLALVGSVGAAPSPQDANVDGVLIVSVVADSPAAEAMIVRGDIILSVDGDAVDDVYGLITAIRSRAPGDEVQLELLHGDEVIAVALTLGDNDGVAFLGVMPYGAESGMGSGAVPGTIPDAAADAEDDRGADGDSGPDVTRIRPLRPGHDAPGPEDVASAQAEEDAASSPTELRPLRPGATAPDAETVPEMDADQAEDVEPADEAPPEEPAEDATQQPIEEPTAAPPEESAADATPEPTEEPAEEPTADATQQPIEEPTAAPPEEPAADATPEAAEEDSTADTDASSLGAIGAVVADVLPGAPADQAGIAAGDVITAVDGRPVDAENDLAALIGQYAPGDEVGITIYDPATDDEMTLVVILGENPNDASLAFLGVAYMPVGQADVAPAPEATPTPQEEEDGAEAAPDLLPFPGAAIGAALVGEVVPDSPAEQAGIRSGDLITAVGGQAIDAENDLATLIGQYAPGDEVELTIVDPLAGEEADIVVVLGENPGDPTLPFLGVRYVPVPAIMDEGVLPLLPPGRSQEVEPEVTPVPDEDAETEAEDEAEAMPEDGAEGTDAADESVAVVVIEVVPGSPAEQAGLQVHDVVTAIDGKSFATVEDLTADIGAYAPGDEVVLTLANPMTSETTTLPVVLGENPETGGAFLGIRFMPLPHAIGAMPFRGYRDGHGEGHGKGYRHGEGDHEEEHRRHHGQPEVTPIPEEEAESPAAEMTPVPEEEEAPAEAAQTDGVADDEAAEEAAGEEEAADDEIAKDDNVGALGAVVARVVPDSPADDAGVIRGDVIIAVDDEPLTAERDLAALIADAAPGDEVALTLWVPDSEDEMTLVVVLGESSADAERAYLGVRYRMFELGDAMTDRPRPYQRQRR